MEVKLTFDNTWVFSDPHFNHKNLISGTTNWYSDRKRYTEQEEIALKLKNCRPFKTLRDHNDTLVSNINDTVPETGVLVCLGDWSFGGIEKIWEFRKRIKCKTLHLVMGNHDHHIWQNRVLPNAFVKLEEKENNKEPFLTGKKYIVDSKKAGDYPARSKDIFTSCDWYLEGRISKTQVICFSHYAMRVWNKSHRGNWMLHGHSHGSLPDYELKQNKFKTMDVGIDTHPEFRPYSLAEIAAIMDKREILKIDHH